MPPLQLDHYYLQYSPVDCVRVCVCVHVYVVYEDTHLYNDISMT